MKVFISWSGEPSKQVAELFNKWLRLVLQSCDPWISTKGIESGSQWFTEIGDQLATANIGIICLTKANKDKPWLLFEAGALLKGLTDGRVCPFLIDLKEQEVSPPLSHLNVTTPERDSVFKLVETINKHLAQPLIGTVLTDTFDTFWPKFQEQFAAIKDSMVEDQTLPVRDVSDILSELLATVRSFDSRLTNMEINSASIDSPFFDLTKTLNQTEIQKMLYEVALQDPGLFGYVQEAKLIGQKKENAYKMLMQHNSNYDKNLLRRMIDLVYALTEK